MLPNLDDLLAKARAATPGPRFCIGDGSDAGAGQPGIRLVVCNSKCVAQWSPNDNALIEALTPECVIALVLRIRELEELAH